MDYILLLPFLLVPLFFLFVTFLIARFGGWKKLAKIYSEQPGMSQFPSTSLSFQYLRIGKMTQYKGAMVVGIDPFGVHLRPVWLFSFAHDPLFFPWSEVVSITKKKFFFTSFALVRLAQTDAELQMIWKPFEQFAEYVPEGKIAKQKL